MQDLEIVSLHVFLEIFSWGGIDCLPALRHEEECDRDGMDDRDRQQQHPGSEQVLTKWNELEKMLKSSMGNK